MDYVAGLWKDAPAVTRTLTALPLILHVAGYFWARQLSLLNLSLASFRQGYFWGVLTSAVWEPPGGLLQTLFCLLIAFWTLSQLPRVERSLGSSKLLLGAIVAAVAINLLFLLMAFGLDWLSQLQGQASVWPLIRSSGLVPLAIYALTLQSLQAGEAETSFFGIPMKAKYYPMVLVGLFALLNGPAVLPDVAALALGFLHSRAHLDSRLPSDGKLQRWENSSFSFLLGRRLFGGHWVRVDQAGTGISAWGGGEALPRHHVIRQGVAARPVQGTEFRVFQGSGHRLGS